ncbi:MAG TPA: Asp-tRNA(Asn)/Glu-tRNA(Gln) amidotransferase subunit GatB [Candidatus Aphodoplasma excrementigallinarum]|uniref:Aspartyl/glutamyl-tRNA(Asn/Gln) amidotransferase subunit B n=1 Tax=Candidatus Aphodoplasma excrementigallinarum TaxID=2840673 RepID=A0A9D1T0D6_9FIRM|nr:Asp-tRNA(Asn)/Glu-tRNA(Gln) amidotransferase subunit GatB [Candidatus Aphodoplasma excrementigallinarum]
MDYKDYEVIIGLEVHAELSTKTKAFCGCTTEFGGDVNTHCCPICTGMPGTLPVLNRKVVEYAIKAGLATNCEITRYGKQDRKNYFYPDLPKAYQISQFDLPLCVGGHVDIETENGKKSIGLTRIHIEEDAGKLLHDVIPGKSLVDFNRCGVPLIEIVSEPDMRSAEEAKAFLEELKSILECLEVSDCKMQEGSLRCDINVSVRPFGQKEYNTRTEMKNVSSFSAAYRAIQYEAKRQIEEMEEGRAVKQQTLRWSDEDGENYALRSKEDAHDYRYFPEPDLVPIVVTDDMIESIRALIPELPSAKRARFVSEYGITDYEAGLISASKSMSAYFEACAKLGAKPKTVANWLLGDIARLINEKNIEFADMKITPEALVAFIALIEKGTISNTAGKKVIEIMFETQKAPDVIVKEEGLEQVNDEGALRKIVEEVLANNQKSVDDYRGGKKNAIGYLVGQTMRLSKGKANPQTMNALLKEYLDAME